MPRQARRMSSTGYMHIIIRGIGRQLLFEEDSDYQYYLTMLEKYSMETGVRICAYCLMENHVHLLVHGEKEQIVLFMKKVMSITQAGSTGNMNEPAICFRTGLKASRSRMKNTCSRYFDIFSGIRKRPASARLQNTAGAVITCLRIRPSLWSWICFKSS